MLPFLFSGTSFETPTYYVLFLLAFLGAILLGARRARAYGLNPVRAVDLGIVLFLGGVIGARLFHVIFEAPLYYVQHPERIFYLWQGGVVLFGGVILGTISGVVFMRYIGEPIGRWADLVAPSMFLGLGIGRMGCLSAGCCHGSPTQSFWGMVFTDPRSAAPLYSALHPTQILEALFSFLMCFVFWRVFKSPPKRPGFALVLALLVYSVFRFHIEFLRGDDDRGYWAGLSTSQWIALVMIGISVVSLKFLRRPSK